MFEHSLSLTTNFLKKEREGKKKRKEKGQNEDRSTVRPLFFLYFTFFFVHIYYRVPDFDNINQSIRSSNVYIILASISLIIISSFFFLRSISIDINIMAMAMTMRNTMTRIGNLSI